MIRSLLLVGIVLASSSLSGCVYWNTMYNAKKLFRDAEKQNNPEEGGTRMSANRRLYEDAIAKAAKVVQKHPKSKYHDDALFLIGVSYFRIDNYSKSESALRELLAVHPKSDYVEESKLYLARCRMQLGDEQAAYRTFTELSTSARKPEWRAEASFQRGVYLASIGANDSAVAVFQEILDLYPNSKRAYSARLLAGEQLRLLKRPIEAMELYQPLTVHKDPLIQYSALVGIGGAAYEADLLDSGIAIFSMMAENDTYADSIGPVRLMLGDGLERRGDLDGAWRQYEQVAAALERTLWSATAYFNMAEIKQYQHNDLASAKSYYDRVREEYASGNLSNLALTRSANIAKLEQFRKSLGRGSLTSASADPARWTYDPEDAPRLERILRSSPIEARPAGFVHSLERDKFIQDSLAMVANADRGDIGTADGSGLYGPETPEEFRNPWDDPNLFGPETPSAIRSAQINSDDTSTTTVASETSQTSTPDAVIYGPVIDSTELIQTLRARELLPVDYWELLVGQESLYGPPSPASLYDFGVGDVLGPSTPGDFLYAQGNVRKSESDALQEREERAALRKEREAAFAEIETAAETQMQLAELYRFDLEYLDSALVEYNDIAERYKDTPYGAQALLAAADIYAAGVGDTASERERLRKILADYPYTDYAGDAISRLGWRGTDADTAHPLRAYEAAEDAYLYDNNPSAAISMFREFVKKYPYSRLVPRAEFAIATLIDRHFPRSDSSVIWAYQEIAATYAQTDFAMAATTRLTATVQRPKPRSAPAPSKPDSAQLAQTGKPGEDPAVKVSEELPRAPRPKIAGQVVFPSADVGVITKEVVVVYRIVIDYSGEIREYELIQRSPSDDLDEATRRAIMETRFDPDSIAPESLNIPYRYEIRITPPAQSPDELDWYNRTGGQPNIPGQP